MANILKLPAVGDEYVGTITRIAEVQGAAGMQVEIDFSNGDRLYLPLASAVRQFLRLNFDGGKDAKGNDLMNYEAIEGNTFRFYRTENRNPALKPYWNIDVADGVDIAASKAPPSKRMTPPDARSQAVAAALDLPSAKGSWADMVSSYRETWALVAGIQGKDATADSIQAGVATLLIQADKRNIPVPSAVAPKPKPAAKLPDPSNDEDMDSALPF